MKFSGNMCFKIILKLKKKKQGFTLSLEDRFFEKPQGGEGGGVNLTTPSPQGKLGLKTNFRASSYNFVSNIFFS